MSQPDAMRKGKIVRRHLIRHELVSSTGVGNAKRRFRSSKDETKEAGVGEKSRAPMIEGFKEIGERHNIEVALLPIGAYSSTEIHLPST
jgi:hypothetical protein